MCVRCEEKGAIARGRSWRGDGGGRDRERKVQGEVKKETLRFRLVFVQGEFRVRCVCGGEDLLLACASFCFLGSPHSSFPSIPLASPHRCPPFS